MNTLALDIGGANIKAAHSAGGAWVIPFALSNQPDQLTTRLYEMAHHAPGFDRLAVTMTAELCDCFQSKRQGVDHVLDAVGELAGDRCIGVWLTDGRFADPGQARKEPLKCAAANWYALACYAAGLFPDGLTVLIDTGSTTTDIIRLRDGRPDATGVTDMQRLATGELVYIGAMHTPLAALAQRIEYRSQRYGLMAESFATTGDAFLLTGELQAEADRYDTADGRPMLREDAAVRIARTVGADMEMMSSHDAADLAHAYIEAACERIAGAIGDVLGDRSPGRVIVSGSGGVLASTAARLALPDTPQTLLADRIGPEASSAACAYALIQLVNNEAPASGGNRE